MIRSCPSTRRPGSPRRRGAHKGFEQLDVAQEDHWLSRSATRRQMLAASIDFLNASNPP
jgi:hypothetical protein